MAGRKSDFSLPTLDDLFSSQEERDAKKNGVIREIPLELIDNFPNHPFKVKDDEEMLELADSVANNGVLLPALVRPKENGRFEMISGHRRKRASEMANIPTIKCMVCNYDDDTAAIVMVDTNLQQRKNIPPSEKAFAYHIKLEALKHQGKKMILTSDPLGPKSEMRSNEQLSQDTGESVRYELQFDHA